MKKNIKRSNAFQVVFWFFVIGNIVSIFNLLVFSSGLTSPGLTTFNHPAWLNTVRGMLLIINLAFYYAIWNWKMGFIRVSSHCHPKLGINFALYSY